MKNNTIKIRAFLCLLFLACGWVSVQAQQVLTVKGVVVDALKEPLPGASIQAVGMSTGTVTDLDGNFKINGKVGTTITVNYVGYAPLEVKITKLTGNRFVMKEDSKTLDEVVVVGMGTQKRNTITAAVATVNADAIAGPL